MKNPENEIETIIWYAERQQDFGYEIVRFSSSVFPDAIVKRMGNYYRAEFEFCASSFIEHEHNPHLCDMIICWKNDFPIPTDFPILELSSGKFYGTKATDENRESILEHIEYVMRNRDEKRKFRQHPSDWRKLRPQLSKEQVEFIARNEPKSIVQAFLESGLEITPRTASNWRVYAATELGVTLQQ